MTANKTTARDQPVKSSNIQPGVKATTKLNGRDQVVTVIGASLGTGGRAQWIVRTPAGNNVYRTARQLRETPTLDIRDAVVTTDGRAMVVTPSQHGRIKALLDSFDATRADGIDAIEDRAHAKAMREARKVNVCGDCGSAMYDRCPCASKGAATTDAEPEDMLDAAALDEYYRGPAEPEGDEYYRGPAEPEGVCRYCGNGNVICACL